MPAVETFKNIPELFEGTYEESIKVRTETLSTFKHLGPDDLVHVVKNIPNSRQHIKEVSSYHFVSGVDTSSSASIAAYINSLTYSLESRQKWFKSPVSSNSWNISKCTFCAFNAFEGTDVRVEARIPGGVKSFVVDVLGTKKGTDADCWQETFISSILRTLRDCAIYSDDYNKEFHNFAGVNDDTFKCAKRCLDGLFTLQTEMKFLETATKLFYKGRQLGTPRGPHLAGNHDNYLTLGVVGYFCLTGRPEISIGFLKGFVEKDPALKCLMFKCLLLANNQSLAIKSIKNDATVFDELASFLMTRGQFEKAEYFASEALKSNPNSFSNWKRLIQIKIALGQPEEALKILNNSPMTVLASSDGEFYKNLPKPVLVSLPGQNNEKKDQPTSTSTSTTATASTNTNNSTSQSQQILEKLKATGLTGTFKEAYNLLVEIYRAIGWDALLECRSRVFVMEREYQKSGGSGEVGAHEKDTEGKVEGPLRSPLNEPSLSKHLSLPDSDFLKETGKKLCERWLDNLILILFEDLRIFTLFSEELKLQLDKKAQGHSLREWYLLAALALRLGHWEEAKLAYQKCLFSTSTVCNNYETERIIESSLINLIKIYCKEGRSQLAILCTLRLLTGTGINALVHPSPVTLSLFSLIEKIGLKRISAEADVEGEKKKDKKLGELGEFFKFVKDAKVHGYDY